MKSDGLRDEVASRIQGDDALAFVRGLGFNLVRRGKEHAIICPFHDDHSPSLTINVNKAKEYGGTYKCFSCGWGGDLFKFVQESQSLDGFRETLDFMAHRLGLKATGPKSGPAPEKTREKIETKSSAERMTAGDVFSCFKMLKAQAADPAPYCNEMGIDPRAVAMIDGFFVKTHRDRASGVYVAGHGPMCMVAPMRNSDGAMISIRFRSMEKKPGERTRRWSLDQTAPGDPQTQIKFTASGLLAPARWFDEAPGDDMSMLVEGETDVCAGLSMMLDLPEPWGVRWFGLPGVGSCHDMLVPEIVGKIACTFMDSDRAGRAAVFDRWPRVCELCQKRIQHQDRCPEPCGGAGFTDRTQPIIPGLLTKLTEKGINAMAAFPPVGETKVDLRDLRKLGWTWPRLRDHVLSTATKKRREFT